MDTNALDLAIVGGVGAIAGSAMTVVGAALQGRRATVAARTQHAHERRLASYRGRVDAYDEILTFASRTRDHINTLILEDKSWDETVADPNQQARLDALIRVHGSEAFREITKDWRQAFDQVLHTLTRWRRLADPTNSEAAETANVRAQLVKDEAKLQAAMDRLQEQARRDVHPTLEPAPREGSTTGPMRVLGTLMIAAGILLVSFPAWAGLLPAVRAAAGNHRDLFAFGFLLAGAVVVLAAGVIRRRRSPESE